MLMLLLNTNYVLYYLILQNAAHTVRLDGDIICQQNEVPIWQAAEGPGSLEDIQSVCSCTALTCDPFHIKAKSRLKRSRRDTLETEEDLQGGLKFRKKCNFWKPNIVWLKY